MFKKIIFYVLTVIITLLTLTTLIFSRDTYSSLENRYLASFPKLTVNFFDDLSDYLSDHFICRDTWIKINSVYQKVILKQEINNIYLSKDNYQIEKYTASNNNDAIIQSINNFISNNKGVDISVLISPTSVAINSDKLPVFAINDEQLNDINEIYENIDCRTIDIYEELLNNEESFYRLDHHWTTSGAYQAYLKYCKEIGIKPIEDNSELVVDNFKGTIFNKTIIDNGIADKIYAYQNKSKLSVEYADKQLTSLYEEEYLDGNDKYTYFMGGNHPLVRVVNHTIESEDKLLVIKDSYANCFIPYLIENYKEIVVVDPRYYGLSIHDYLIENKITDVLFLYNMNTLKDDIGIIGIE